MNLFENLQMMNESSTKDFVEQECEKYGFNKPSYGLVGYKELSIDSSDEAVEAFIREEVDGAGDNITINKNSNNELQAIGLINKNEAAGATNPIYDWIGTQQEYIDQDIAAQHPDWVCFITDDAYNPQSTYSYDQGVAADTWHIAHFLNKYPSVTVVDSAGTTIDCTVTYINSNECELKFNAAFKGTAYLN